MVVLLDRTKFKLVKTPFILYLYSILKSSERYLFHLALPLFLVLFVRVGSVGRYPVFISITVRVDPAFQFIGGVSCYNSVSLDCGVGVRA